MPRFVKMLAEGMQARHHQVEVWQPLPRFYRIPAPQRFKKWLGYLDQFLVFPLEVRLRMRAYPSDTLFAFADHALGPWVPIVNKRPHVVHCHDFLAQQSALGREERQPTSWTGKRYQALIRKGFSRASHFISVSQKTEKDLHDLIPTVPGTSEVVYNGMAYPFRLVDPAVARLRLMDEFGLSCPEGFLLHVGGNLWYKNRAGVIHLYDAWRNASEKVLPLVMMGEAPDARLCRVYERSPYKQDIHLLAGVNDEAVNLAYCGASVLLFPSLAEGFGWPVAEAMACGCPVITTAEPPMSEVGGTVAFYIPAMPANEAKRNTWSLDGALVVEQVLSLSESEREAIKKKGWEQVTKFTTDRMLAKMEAIYARILDQYQVR